MADCGAAGTALDRAARFVEAASNGGVASKQAVGSILGHVTVGSQNHGAISNNSPDFLIMPGNDSFLYTPARGASAPPTFVAPSAHMPLGVAAMDSIWNQQHQPYNIMNGPPLQHNPHVMHQLQHQHHPFMLQGPPPSMMNQHLSFIHHQEQQRHFFIQQEMAARARMQMFEMGQRQAELASTMQPHYDSKHVVAQESIPLTTEEDVANRWHEGLEEDVQAELEGDTIGHEGIVSGATIDELAAAWAQAEDDYEREVANLWTGDPQVGEEPPLSYEFTHKDSQPPEQDKDRDWLNEGMQQFREGNIREAIYLFEMELQHHNPDNATAWKMLGRCHAENDQDRQAIACLEQAVERDPYSSEALLALGVSYVNELDHDRALLNLKAWITHNPKFAGLDLSEDVYGAATTATTDGRESAFEEVQRLLLRALEFDPTDAADVHEALGVVYNVSRDYEAAVASFRKAIDARPDDYQLWNKLGATLANSNQSDKALPAYHQALQLKPKYARAWLNMAISHSNLQNYDEAARCYLQTISLNPSAVHCWSYLRIALSCSERWDLIPFAASQDLKAFRDHYDFILYNTESSLS